MGKNFGTTHSIAHFLSVLSIILLFFTTGFAQHLTISSSGQTGTSGTNWSINGNNLNVAASGSANIHPSVITNHLSNVGDLIVNLPWQSGKPRNMNIDASISYAGGNNRTLTFNCANDMIFANATGITSSFSRLNLVLRTALGSVFPDHGLIQLNGVTIQTNGGHFWAGGGTTTTTWNGLTIGNGAANTWLDDLPGISLVGSSITTNGGNLYLAGLSWNSSDDDGANYGVFIRNTSVSTASGSIEINGEVRGRYTIGFGTNIDGTSGAVSIGTSSGAITINGNGYDATSSGNSWRHGIQCNGDVAIRTVSGDISILGSANFSSAINDKEGIIFGTGTSVCSRTGNITLRGTNSLESSGQYSNAIRFSAANSTNAIRIGFDGTNPYSGNILIEGNSIYQRLNNAGPGSIAIQTTGNLTIQPTGNAFTYMRAGDSGSLTFDDDWNFGTSLGSFTYGKSTNAANLTLSRPITTSGAMRIYAGNIVVQQNLTSTLNNAEILLQSTGYIEIAASRTIQTNNGNITLRANSGGTAVILPNGTTGSITLNSGSSLLSNGGNITLGGNFAGTEGAGLYAASARSGGSPGVLINNATLTAAGGNIKIYGKCNSSYDDGVRLQANITTTGTGTIGIYGDAFGGNNNSQYFGGITFFEAISNIETDQGDITLAGKLINTQINNTYGINFYRSDGSSGQTRHIQILSRSGDVQITGDRGTTGGGGIGYSSWGNIYFGSPSNNSWVATGDLVFTYSSFVGAGLNGFKVKTRGAVTYQPVGTSFASAQTFPYNSNYTVAESASSLIIGKTGNTADITINSDISVAGPITIYGGNINQNANISSTAASNISLLGTLGLYTSNTRKAITSAGGNITINADIDANGSGLLDLDFLTLNPGIGNIIIRGETFNWSTFNDSHRPWINGTGSFTLESNDASFGQGVNLNWFKLDQDANGMGGLTIGKSTNNQHIIHDHAGGLAIDGPITMYGAYLEINENLISIKQGSKLFLKSNGWVWVNTEGKTVRTNNGDIIFWADADNSQLSSNSNSDEVGLRAGSILNSQGGKIILAGGLDDGANGGLASDDIPDNYAYRGAGESTGGVNLGVAGGTGVVVSLLSGGGDITIKGRSASNGTNSRPGVTSQSNLLINSGTGRINIQGVSSVNHGIELTYGASPNIAITSSYAGVGPAITIAGGSTPYDGIRLFNANGGNVLIQSTSSSGGGILMEGSQIAAANVAIRLANENSTSNLQILAANGDIILRAAPVGIVTQGLGQILSHGNLYFGSRLNSTAVQGITPSVLSTNANVLFSGSNVLFDGVRTTKVGTTGTFTLEPRTADNSFSASTIIRNIDISTVSAFTAGKAGNSAALTLSSALTISAPMTFHGGAFNIGGALTATNNTINIYATGAVTQTAAISANNLGLHGTGTFTLNNASNNVVTLAGGEIATRLGSLSFTDASGGLTIETVGTKNGIYTSGTLLVETLNGDLTIAQNISTTNTTSNAIILNAGKSAAIGSLTGGNVKITGSPLVTMGTGGITKIFSGIEDQSTGLSQLIGNPANVRNSGDETTTIYVPVLETNKTYAIYRTARGRGDLTIVSSGGDAEGTTWIYENETIFTISSPVTIRDSVVQRKLLLGDVAIEANKVTFSANINNQTVNAFKVLSKTHINNTQATIISSRGGDVLLASNVDNATDFDSTNNGYIQFRGGLTINTQGGDITLGGGNNQGSDYALGSSAEDFTEGVRIDLVANFNSGGGNIAIRGKSFARSVPLDWGASGLGILFLTSADTINSGTGTILLDGYSQTTTSQFASGIVFHVNNASYPFTIQSANTTANAIKINGYAHGTSGQAFGLESESNTVLNITATALGGGIIINVGNNTTNFYDIVLRGQTNILANGGPISLLGKYNEGKSNGYMFVDNNVYIGSKAGSAVTSSSSDITIQFDSYNFSHFRPFIATRGAVDWKPASASFTYLIQTDWFNWNQNAQTMRSFTLGKSGNAGNLLIDKAIAAAGPISMYGGVVTLNAALTSSDTGNIFLKSISTSIEGISNNSTITKSGGTGVLTMQGNTTVRNGGTITTSGSGKLNVVIWSDFDNTNNDGGVGFDGTISTNGGHVWMGGSNSNGGSYTWNGLTVGNGPSIGTSNSNNYAMDFFGNITTNGGDVLAWAGNGVNSGINGIITNNDGSTITTGNGDLIFIADQVIGSAGNSIVYSGTGKVYLLPDAGSYGTTLNWTHNNTPSVLNIGGIYEHLVLNNSTSITGLTFGYYDQMSDSSGVVIMTNSSPVTLSSPNTIAGSIGIYGGAIAMNANFATTDTLTGNIIIKGSSVSGSGNLTLAKTRNATIDVSATSTYDGVISGNQASFTKAGTSLLTLTNNHTYSGLTSVSKGNLQVGSGGSLSQASVGNISNTSAVVVDSMAKLILAPNGDISFSKPISGNGGLEIKGASGTYYNVFLTSTVATIDTNATVLELLTRITGGLQAGTAVAANGFATQTAGAYVKSYNALTNIATLQFQQFDGTFTKCVFAELSQSGSKVQIRANTSVYNGAAYRSGNHLGVDMSTGSTTIGSLATSPTSAGYGISNVYMSGKVNFNGALTYTGTTTLSNTLTSVTSPNTYSFTSKGTQEITDTSSSFPGAVLNNGLVIFKRATPLTIAGNMSGSEDILQLGAPITLTGNNTLSGIITIARDSSLMIGNGGTSGSVAGNIINYGLLTFNRSDSSSYPGILSGSGNLIKSGQGALLMTGANSYTGPTVINAGNLIFERDIPSTTSSSFTGAGKLEIRPRSASFTNAINYPISGFNVSTNIGGLIIGKPGNTANISLIAPILFDGSVTFYGGDLDIGHNVRTNNAGADVLFIATGKINLGASDTIYTNAGDVSFWADADVNSTGYVQLRANSSIVTAGGDINLGGGSNLTTGFAFGTALETCTEASPNTQYISGVHLRSGTALTSNGGNITIRGQNANTANAAMSFGVGFRGSVINSGTGKISIMGVANGSVSANAQGVSNWGQLTLRSASTASDAISIIGDASNVNNAGTSMGINMNAILEATGTGGGLTLDGRSGTATGTKISTAFYGDLLAASGPITIIGANSSGIQDNVNFPGTTVIGKKTGTNVTSSSSNVTIEGNVIATPGAVTIDCIGSLTVRPNGSSFAAALSWPKTNVTVPGALTGLTLGKTTNIANVTVAANQSISGPVSIYGGKISINGALTATNNDINFHATDSVIQTAPITANGLGLHGPGHFNLTHASNNISTIAGGDNSTRLGSLQYVDLSGGLEIGSVNPTGIYAAGPVLIETLNGDIDLKEPISSNSNIDSLTGYNGAIVLNAGKNNNILVPTGGGINVTANGAVSAPNGIVKLYGGNSDDSKGLNALVGGVVRTRLYVDETTTTFSPVLTSKGKFALYRDRSLCFADTASTTPSLCINTGLPVITHVTAGATGIGTPSGLPAGVTAQWASNEILLSGTPTVAGIFNYTIPLTGPCGAGNPVATGTITVTASNTASTASESPTLCINNILPRIRHNTTGASGIGTVSGLPTGVSAVWHADSIIITGTPTDAGTFNYNILLSGGCGNINATGIITVLSANTFSAASSASLCTGTLLTNLMHKTTVATGIGSAAGLPPGVTAYWSNDTISINGKPTSTGTFNYLIPLTGGCGNVNATGSLIIFPGNTASAASSNPTLCVNSILTNIKHTTTGSTGIGIATGLPAGVTAQWLADTITISGTPTVSGTFNYNIPLTGGCDSVNATGSIIVMPVNSVSVASSMPSLCVQTSMIDITHTTTGATGIGTGTGFPAGVNAVWASNTIIISGTPTETGTFNYLIPLTGGCGIENATGKITVTLVNSTSSASSTPVLCVNSALTNITHATKGATGIGSVTGLPPGVNALWENDTIIINGTPTAAGTFNYIIPLNGGCGNVDATGSMTVLPDNIVSAPSSSPTLCVNTLMPNITHSLTGATGIDTVTGIPAGVNVEWANDTITLSGTPTESGIFNYTIHLNDGCGNAKATGMITITPVNTVSVASSSPTLCENALLTNITHITTGATGIGVATDLPAGVKAEWSANKITISGTPTQNGTFNYSIPLIGGCDSLVARGTIKVTPVVTASIASSTPSLCINTLLENMTHTTTGAIGIGLVTGLPAGVKAEWASNKITISGTPTQSGSFNYNILLLGGCDSIVATGTISVIPNSTVSIASSTPTLCEDELLNNITHTTTGATGIGLVTGLPSGLKAEWASNMITISGSPNQSGTFNYSIPLVGGCDSIVASGTITVIPIITVSLASSTPTLCENSLLTNITLISSGATGIGLVTGLPAGVKAEWASNMITISGTPTQSGTFNYNIPLTGGCDTVNAKGTIYVKVTPLPTISAMDKSGLLNNDGIICKGETTILIAEGGSTFKWNNGDTSSVLSISPDETTDYSVTVTANDGCDAIATTKITVNAKPLPTVVSTNPDCPLSQTGTATASSGTGWSYLWSNGSNTATITGLVQGLYNVTVTDENGCKGSSMVNLNDLSLPLTISLSKTDVICQGTSTGTISLVVSGGVSPYSFLWSSNTGGATTASLSNLPAGSYSVTVTEGSSSKCKVVGTAEIIEPTFGIQTSILVSENSGIRPDDGIICQNDVAELIVNAKTISGGAISSFQWSNASENNSNILNIKNSGLYTVTITDSKGCKTTANKEITVTPNNKVSVGSSSPTLCVNTSLTNIIHTTEGSSGIGNATGLPAGVIAEWSSNTITISGTPIETGIFNYNIPLTGDCDSVHARGIITVNLINTVSSASITPTLCVNTSLTNITHSTVSATGIGKATGLPAGITAIWEDNTITISGIPTESGTFNYSIPLTGGCGNATATGKIRVMDELDAFISVTDKSGIVNNDGTICVGESAILTAEGGSSFKWQSGESSSMLAVSPMVSTDYSVTITSSDGCSAIATAKIIVQGLYKVTVTDENGCKGTATATISDLIQPLTIGVAKTDILCQGGTTGSISLNISGGTAPYLYKWSSNAGAGTSPSISNLPAGNYNVTVTESSGNKCSAVGVVEITEPEFGVLANIIVKENSGQKADDGIICQNEVASMITSTWVNPGSTISSYFWNDSSNSSTKSIIVDEPGTYIVTVTDSKGCSTTVSRLLEINLISTVSDASSTPTLCSQTALTNITHTTTGATGIGRAVGLPAGVTAIWSSNIITIRGKPTESGLFNYTIPITGGCENINATGTITVSPISTVSAASTTPTLCVQTALTNITHTTTGSTGIGRAVGLPAGVTATWSSELITISGTPTESGLFNYTIPLAGGCGNINATGTIKVSPFSTVSAASTTPTLCVQTTLTNITHTTTGSTGIGRAVGLPEGVTATWSSNLITISGTPTESGLFNYTIPLTGGCDNIKAIGAITVTPANTVSSASATPTLMINSLLPAITHTTTGATGIITVKGLPSGVLPSWSSNIITIRGTPTESGIFNYRITLMGGCGNLDATGTITVLTDNKVDDLLCDQLVIDNTEIYKDELYDGVIILSYKGGNGTNFAGFTISSTGVSGLNLSLKLGKLAFGQGSIELIARGVPTDTGKAIFNINLGAKSCVVELPVKVLLPKLSSIDCNNSQLTPDDIGKDMDYTGVLKINYQGGNNGKIFPVTLSSTGVSGLTLTGDSLRLNPLGGNIKYSITGKPMSTGVASFNISIGDKTCYALFNVIDNEIKLSNFFTPNGDGKNDRWEIPALVFYPEAKVYIFDRTGRLLVEYSGASPGWDGMIGNYPASSGDYWYMIHLTKNDIRKGNFTLIK